jgi:Cu-Zn family superoxide dismutase
MNTKQNINFLALITVLFLLSNCMGRTEKQNDQSDENIESSSYTEESSEEIAADSEYVATLNSASGSNIIGSATFTKADDVVTIKLSISNATPGSHAVHLHENGDCSADDATSAGGHWNPTNTEHGKRGNENFHKGDIANIIVDADGNGSLEMTVRGWTIGGPTESDILNKAVIIHAGADDFTSQPSGAAGKRVACGVIEKKQVNEAY